MWAPEIHFVGGRFLVYYSGRKRFDLGGYLAIGVAISANPESPYGPYLDHGSPIIDILPGVIDVHWFRDPK